MTRDPYHATSQPSDRMRPAAGPPRYGSSRHTGPAGTPTAAPAPTPSAPTSPVQPTRGSERGPAQAATRPLYPWTRAPQRDGAWQVRQAGARTKPANVTLWTVSVLVAAVFFLSGLTKLMALPEVVEMWAFWGHPAGLMYVIGVVELVGAVAVLVPRFAFWGAATLSVVMIGAILTHVAVGQWLMLLLPIVVGSMTVFIAWAREGEAAPTRHVRRHGMAA